MKNQIFLLLSLVLLSACTDNKPGSDPIESKTPFQQIGIDLIERWFPGKSNAFDFEEISKINGNDIFQISSAEDKILIGGSNGIAIASGFHWYLKNFCQTQIDINGCTTPLPDILPLPEKVITKETIFENRNFFNYCTFGYTTPWWNWEQWERLIDWMAMNGVNMPLAITGQEAVWQQLLEEQGLTKNEIESFLVGPAFLPWGWMGNIDGMAGPLPQSWIDKHVILQNKILERERAFGMTPILQGFTGHIPKALIDKNPDLQFVQTTDWAGMPGTYFLDPKDSLFGVLGKRFIEIQTNLFGTDHLYDADCFNEVNPPTNDTAFIAEVSRAVYTSMTAADPEAKWVMQGWFLFWQRDFWQEPQAKALLDPIPNEKLLLLDLYGEKHTVWDKTKAFYGKPWVWNIICNNGQKVNLSGDLQVMNDNLQDALHNSEAGNLTGIGVMMEGFGYNPVVQDLIGHLTWETDSLDIGAWIKDYTVRRYGQNNTNAQIAWQGLINSVYSRSTVGENIICLPPSGIAPELTPESPYGLDYPYQGLQEAAIALLNAADSIEHVESYQFDLVHIYREILSAHANKLIANAYNALENKDAENFSIHMNAFLILLEEMDGLLRSNEHFLLGKWIADARAFGDNQAEADYYEMNARTILTLWQPSTSTHLRDYASRQWNGLIGDFYYDRWELFMRAGTAALANNMRVDYGNLNIILRSWELNWTKSTNTYPSTPTGNTVQICKILAEKYVL